MVTRSQAGIVKPIDRLSLHTSPLSPIPKSPFLALKDPNWPSNVNLVRSMWLFKHKFHDDGTLSRYKARLVANGSSQQVGVDFDETFSPVVKPATIRTFLALLCLVGGLFTNLMLRMHFLTRSLYGLKQAPHAWFQRFAGYATRAGFSPSRCDSSLFIYTQGSQVSYLLIYVDDIILAASSSVSLQQIIDSLHKEFDMTNLGALNYFHGIFAIRHSIGLFLSQKKYALQLLERAISISIETPSFASTKEGSSKEQRNESNNNSQFEKKTMTVMRGGEMVQDGSVKPAKTKKKMLLPMPIMVYGNQGNVKRIGLSFSISSRLQLGIVWLGEDEMSEGKENFPDEYRVTLCIVGALAACSASSAFVHIELVAEDCFRVGYALNLLDLMENDEQAHKGIEIANVLSRTVIILAKNGFYKFAISTIVESVSKFSLPYLPPGFESSEFPDYVCKLDKALYGLKQAPKACSSVKTPMVPPNNLGPDLAGKPVNETSYRGMIGYQSNPKESHLISVKRILIYLKGTPTLGLYYPKCSSFDLKGYSNSDYVGCNMDIKSTSGACQLLGGKLVCWSAKKQQSVAMSSTEAEYVAAAGCCASIIWLKSQLSDYDIHYKMVTIFCDNTSSIAISNNLVLHSRTKHIDIRYYFISDHILKGNIKLHFIPTKYQLADIFTKPLDEPTFTRLKAELGITAVAFDPFPSTDELEKRPLKEFLIKFLVSNGQRPLTLDFKTFCSSTGLDYNNGKYVEHSTPKVVKKELGKIAINPSYLDKTSVLKNSFPVAWRILFTFVIQVLSGNYSSTEQVNSTQQLLAYSLITRTEVGIGEIIYSDLSQGPEASGALSKMSKRPKSKKPPTKTKVTPPKTTKGSKQSHSVSSGTVPDPQDLERDIQLATTGLPSTLDERTRKSKPLPEGTATHSKDSGGNKQPLDRDITFTTSDEGTAKTTPHPEGSRTGAKYQEDQTQSSRLRYQSVTGNKATLLSKDEAQESEEDILGAVSLSTVPDPQDLVRDIQLTSTRLPSTLDEGTRKSTHLPEGTDTHPQDSGRNKQPLDRDITSTTPDESTAKTMPCLEGLLVDKDSGGNIPPADMEPIHTPVADLSGTGAKEYDLWSMRMEQYLTFTDHALWEVIVNGDSVSPVASASTGAEGPIPPKTAEQKLARKND
ncbi:retrovirus-related pol polyprotein from transposon TNT 1-94 [Tanacetum coccineum]|uniref:Retrovirus-related pol polyprotein from transposon TNT 1-94 n=1 Tax=Tanacetum coccineum TaxID=301880 RepID=A0ABQ5CKY3_9ASTR